MDRQPLRLTKSVRNAADEADTIDRSLQLREDHIGVAVLIGRLTVNHTGAAGKVHEVGRETAAADAAKENIRSRT